MKRLTRSEFRVIRTLFLRHRPTRRLIAKSCGLSLVNVSSVLNNLGRAGFIRRVGTTRSSGGRPSYLFRLTPLFGSSLGISLSRDAIRVVALDATKDLVLERQFPLALSADPEQHGEAILHQVATAAQEVMEDLPREISPATIGLALPGMVDTQRGLWLLGLQLTGVTHVHLARLLQERLKVPVFTEDISRALTYRQMLLGLGRTCRTFVLIYAGLGLGTGVVIDRRLYRGHHGLAGELGHLEHVDNTYRCSCGNIGCLETIVSVPGMLRVFRDRLNEGVVSSLQRTTRDPSRGLTLERILASADEGDRFTRATLREIGGFLGRACAMMVKLFNPRRLIVSGEGAMFREYLREPVNQVIKQEVIPEMLEGYRTLFDDYAPHDEAVGAGLLAMTRLIESGIRGESPIPLRPPV